ncbi:MAG TPA: GAF domain-containing protein [Solirubrobacterales bacterium]
MLSGRFPCVGTFGRWGCLSQLWASRPVVRRSAGPLRRREHARPCRWRPRVRIFCSGKSSVGNRYVLSILGPLTMTGESAIRSWEGLLDELRAEFEIREAELRLLHEIDLRILGDEWGLAETLEFICLEAAGLLGASAAQIYLRRGTAFEQAVDRAPWFPAGEFEYEKSAFAELVMTGERLAVGDYSDGAVLLSRPPWEGADAAPRSLIAVPIRSKETVLGVFCAVADTDRAFQATHLEICEAIAPQIAIALENAELFDQTSLFERVDRLVFSDEPTEEVLQRALEAVFDELRRLDYAPVAAAQLLFTTDDPGMLRIVHSTNDWDVGLRVATQDSVVGRALTERRTLVIDDVTKDPDYKRMLGSEIRSEIAVPIMVGANEVPIGVLNVESKVHDAFGGVYQLVLDRFARKVSMLLAITKLRSDISGALEAHHSAELMIAVGDQASNMIHRLNNVVGAMRFRIREVQENCSAEVEGSDFLRESLDHLLRAADETLELPKRVRAFLLAEGGGLSEFDVNAAIEGALSSVTVPENVKLNVSLAPEIPTVQAFSLGVAAENLIRNAIDAMPDGGELSITSELVAVQGLPAGRVELTFRDTGIGMSPETRRRLFEIDFTTKPRKEGKGMGVGLWWVRQWVRRSRGEITVDSEKGKGTIFVIKLPLVLEGGEVPGAGFRPTEKGG